MCLKSIIVHMKVLGWPKSEGQLIILFKFLKTVRIVSKKKREHRVQTKQKKTTLKQQQQQQKLE